MASGDRLRFMALLALSMACACGSSHAQGGEDEQPVASGRHALVIGNATHAHLAELPSAREDARHVTEQLRDLGFNVMTVDGLASAKAFNEEVLPTFRDRLRDGDLVVFFFSGHGFSYGPDNFLAPLDMPTTLTRNELADRAIAVEGVQAALAKRKPGVLLMLIDACRTVAGFIVPGAATNGLIPKGMASPQQPAGLGTNTLIGFAARPGTVALGSSEPGHLSVFTAALVARIGAANQEFGTVFDDVSADVRIGTDDSQEPGLMDWSTSDLFMRTEARLEALEREAWIVAKSSGRRDDVGRFLRRHAVSSYAAVARRWLADHPVDIAPSSDVSPLAVDQAWLQPAATILGSGNANFTFPSRADAAAVRAQANFANVFETGSSDGGSASTSFQLGRLLAHRQVIAAADMVARTAPSPDAAPLGTILAGSAVVVRDVQRRTRTGAWLDVQMSPNGQRGYVPLSAGPSSTLRSITIGTSLLEIVAKPLADGLPELLDADAITAALAQLASQAKAVSRVSLVSSGDSSNERERLDRRSRLNHATYLLRTAGIPAAHITAVTDAPDFHGNGVRIRFFGQ